MRHRKDLVMLTYEKAGKESGENVRFSDPGVKSKTGGKDMRNKMVRGLALGLAVSTAAMMGFRTG